MKIMNLKTGKCYGLPLSAENYFYNKGNFIHSLDKKEQKRVWEIDKIKYIVISDDYFINKKSRTVYIKTKLGKTKALSNV